MCKIEHSPRAVAKGRLNSEWIYEVNISPKMKTKNYVQGFLPYQTNKDRRQKTAYTYPKITKKSATILVFMVGQKFL